MEIPSKAAKTQGLKGILSFKTVKDRIIKAETSIYEVSARFYYYNYIFILLSQIGIFKVPESVR